MSMFIIDLIVRLFKIFSFFITVIISHHKHAMVCFCDKNTEGKTPGLIGKMSPLSRYRAVIAGVSRSVMAHRSKCR